MKKTENLLDKDRLWAKLCIQDLPDIEQGCHSLNQNVQLLLLSCHVLTAKKRHSRYSNCAIGWTIQGSISKEQFFKPIWNFDSLLPSTITP